MAQVDVVLYDADGDHVGVLSRVMAPFIDEAVGQIGRAGWLCPRSEPGLALATIGRRVGMRCTDGYEWAGKIVRKELRIDQDGGALVAFDALDLGVELQKQSTYMGVVVDDLSAQDAADLILAGAENAWTATLVGSGFVDSSNRYDNMSLWSALGRLAETENAFLRTTETPREVELVRTAPSSGIVLTNAQAASAQSRVGLIEALLGEEEGDVVNRVVPLGLANGQIAFDLGRSSRSSPYTIQTLTPVRPSVVDFHVFGSGTNPGVEPFSRPIRVQGPHSLVILHASDGVELSNARVLLNGLAPIKIFAEGAGRSDLWLFQPIEYGLLNLDFVGQIGGGRTYQVISLRDCDVDLSEMPHAVAGTPTVPDSFSDLDSHEEEVSNINSSSLTLDSTDSDLVLSFVQFTMANADDPTIVPGSGITELIDQGVDSADIGTVTDKWFWLGLKPGSDSGVTMDMTFSAINTAAAEDFSHIAVSVKAHKTYYLEDASSVAAYGLSVETLIEQALKAVGLTDAQLGEAANTLYDWAATVLGRKKDPPKSWRWAVSYLPGLPSDWLVGDTMRVIYRDADAGAEIDETLYVVRRRQDFDEAGVRRWTLTHSTVPALPKSEEDLLLEQLRRLMALEAA